MNERTATDKYRKEADIMGNSHTLEKRKKKKRRPRTRLTRGENDWLTFPLVSFVADWVLKCTLSRPAGDWFELLHIKVHSALRLPADCNLLFMCMCMYCSGMITLQSALFCSWRIFTNPGSTKTFCLFYIPGKLLVPTLVSLGSLKALTSVKDCHNKKK